MIEVVKFERVPLTTSPLFGDLSPQFRTLVYFPNCFNSLSALTTNILQFCTFLIDYSVFFSPLRFSVPILSERNHYSMALPYRSPF